MTGQHMNDYLRHRLSVVGVDSGELRANVVVLDDTHISATTVRQACAAGRLCLAIRPEPAALEGLGVRLVQRRDGVQRITASDRGELASGSVKALHGADSYDLPPAGRSLLEVDGQPCWAWLPVDRSGVLLIGTSITEDLLQYAQGDASADPAADGAALWDLPIERPNYLFERQRAGDPPGERQADDWAFLLARLLADLAGVTFHATLPGGAVGAVVITGDDDHAYLDTYAAQRSALTDLPITYFLHPATRHDRASLADLAAKGRTEFGLHPDAIETPDAYADCLDRQAAWFTSLVGSPPTLVRNHGYLNKGYWTHADAWIATGIRGSANLPGLDGNALTGSLLPARLLLDGRITDHWSVLTVFGDGMLFAGGYTDEQAADRIRDLAAQVVASGNPGVLVLNLHPQNIADTPLMHRALLESIDAGFIAWSLTDCLSWFARRDGGTFPDPPHLGSAAQGPLASASVDTHPWEHPFLSSEHIAEFRAYSEEVHEWAAELADASATLPTAAFTVNMAQNMYRWAAIAQSAGWDVALIPHPQERTALNDPHWEDFDGEWRWPLDGQRFIDSFEFPPTRVPLRECVMDGADLIASRHRPWWTRIARARRPAEPLPGRLAELLDYEACYPYYAWARELAGFDVSCAAGSPIASYASGQPYVAFSVGGDLQFECGRVDDASRLQRKAFSQADYLLATNPHTLGHCRRLGFQNAVHVPYPMDTERYSPGEGASRREWVQRTGGELFVLTTSRIDEAVKGFGEPFLDDLAEVALRFPQARFVFLQWGNDVAHFAAGVTSRGLGTQVLLLPPVGKVRLIDYYRSSDVVVDQLTFGYYGAAALEAMSVGKPVVMHVRDEQYSPLYRGDVAPVLNTAGEAGIAGPLERLLGSRETRLQAGKACREWVLRNHGERTAGAKMLNLMAAASHRTSPPHRVVARNPLLQPLSEAEQAYHRACLAS
ncbi:MAG: glycosyltransferase [Actinomycetota bacterium]|nr:glycosyltransferase [Actinomycetota bacterium]